MNKLKNHIVLYLCLLTTNIYAQDSICLSKTDIDNILLDRIWLITPFETENTENKGKWLLLSDCNALTGNYNKFKALIQISNRTYINNGCIFNLNDKYLSSVEIVILPEYRHRDLLEYIQDGEEFNIYLSYVKCQITIRRNGQEKETLWYLQSTNSFGFLSSRLEFPSEN